MPFKVINVKIRLNKIFSRRVAHITKSGESILSIKDLRMRYGSNEVLKGIDLDVYPGQVIGYIGPNGAGKSTTVKIMLGMVEGYTGCVQIFGQDISKGDVNYKGKIGYVPETSDIYENLTAQEYLTFVGELYGLAVDEADEKAKKLAEVFDLQRVYSSRIASYSKGMRQKLLIISSLLHNPDLLFFDEPLSGLDANSVMIFKEILAQLSAKGKTVFYSSHIMDVVEKISDRIVLLSDGRITADGSFEDLKKQNREGSLEEIFNDLTGFNEHGAIARSIVEIVQGA